MIEGATADSWKLTMVPAGDCLSPEGMSLTPDGKEL